LKQAILNNIKNIWGWKTQRKILVLSVDDYGNVRLDSKKARHKMDDAGLLVRSRFDAFDTMETKEDLESLYETLTSVKDANGNNAKITAFTLPCNIDFERLEAENYTEYFYELLPKTFEKLTAKDSKTYEGTWKLWKEGIKSELLIPQYHGREHLNLKVFKEKLRNNDKEVAIALKNRSYTSISNSGYKDINYTAAFDFWDPSENKALSKILIDGINQFQNVFGYRPVHFMPPTSNIHSSLLPVIKSEGIKYMDTNLIHNQHQGFGKYKKSYNFTGKKVNSGNLYIVRNVVFEPTVNNGVDWVGYSLDQIAAAFRWNRPAIISSHRVNFCGYIEPKNRLTGIFALRNLLKKVVERWPDVEFMGANELGDLISKSER